MESWEAYKILGMSESSSYYEIRSAYRRLAKKAHPDKGGSQQGFIRLRSAYEVLCVRHMQEPRRKASGAVQRVAEELRKAREAEMQRVAEELRKAREARKAEVQREAKERYKAREAVQHHTEEQQSRPYP